jgi:hypothetical protein
MKNIKKLLSILALCVFVNACSSAGQKTKPDIFKEFADNGRTADSLRKAFQCESITLDKWESSEVTDSTFSFCLINAKTVPTMEMAIENDMLKEIAKSLKKAVKNPTKYNSYQIVFVKSDKNFAGGTQSHQLGGTISSKGL